MRAFPYVPCMKEGSGIAVATMIGAAFGAAMDNIALGIGIELALGIATAYVAGR